MKIETNEVKHAANGNWPSILGYLAGLDARQLSDVHQPCPACNGNDRYRYDDKTGNGDHYCNQCGAGDGLSLLQKVNGWDFPTAVQRVAAYLGMDTENDNIRPTPKALAKRNAEQQAAEHARQRQNAEERAKAANIAQEICKAGRPANDDTPYLKRKGACSTDTLREIDANTACKIAGYTIKAGGEPLIGVLLVVPIKIQTDNCYALSSVEFIDGQGRKHGLAGGQKKAVSGRQNDCQKATATGAP